MRTFPGCGLSVIQLSPPKQLTKTLVMENRGKSERQSSSYLERVTLPSTENCRYFWRVIHLLLTRT